FTSTTLTGGASSVSNSRRMSNSSTMTECPACNISLSKVGGGKPAQEEHVRNCLENKNGNSVSGYKYVVYKLLQNNFLVGQECPICFEEFLA
ncbi:32195_t:CDS:2, partial [Racocetra persica]